MLARDFLTVRVQCRRANPLNCCVRLFVAVYVINKIILNMHDYSYKDSNFRFSRQFDFNLLLLIESTQIYFL